MLVSISAVVLLLGVLKPALAIVGLILLAASVTGWIREDVRELRVTKARAGRSDYWYAAVFLVMSEIVLFGVLFTYYFWARSYSAQWPPAGIPEPDLALVTVNTVILLSSGVTAHAAQNALAAGNRQRFRRLLGVTVALGAVFLAGQAYEYATAGFLPTSGTYGTAFFALTGVHGLHVLGGLIVLSILFGLSRQKFLTPARLSGVSGAILYWHFVDAVWVVLYVTLYLRWV